MWGAAPMGVEPEPGMFTHPSIFSVFLSDRGASVQVPCPLSCGMELMRRNLSFHVQHECAKRQVSCKYVAQHTTPTSASIYLFLRLKVRPVFDTETEKTL